MPDRYVRMRFMSSGEDKVKSSLDDLTERAYALNKVNAKLQVGLNDTEFETKQKTIRAKFDVLKHETAKLNVGIDDDKYTIAVKGIMLKQKELGEMLAKPKVELEGYEKASLEMDKLKLQADELAKTYKMKISAAHVLGDLKTSGKSSNGALGDLKSLLSRATKGRNGGLSGNTGPLQGLLSGGPGQAAAGIPAPVLGGIAGVLASLVPSVVGLGIGGGVGAAGVGLTSLFAKQGSAAIKAARARATAADKAQAVKPDALTNSKAFTANIKLQQAQQKFGPFAGITQDVKNLETPIMGIIKPFAAGLGPIIKQLGVFEKAVGPSLSAMFKASLPFVKSFLSFMEHGGKALIPAFTGAMVEMVKSGALKEMTSALILLINSGLVPFIKELGPGMKASAGIFATIMKITAGALRVLGFVFTGLAVAINVWGHGLEIAGKLAESVFKYWYSLIKAIGKVVIDVFHGDFAAAWRAIQGFGKDVSKIFGDLRHFVASQLDNLGLGKLGHDVANTFDGIRHDIASVWDATWRWVSKRFSDFVSFFKNLALSWHNGIKNTFDAVRHDIASIWDAMWRWVGKRFSDAVSFLKDLAGTWHNDIKNTFNTVRHDVSATWDHLWKDVTDRLGQWYQGLKHDVGTAESWITSTFDSIKSKVAHTWDNMWGAVKGLTKSAIHDVGNIINGIKSAFTTPFNWVVQHAFKPLASIWNAFAKDVHLPQVHLPSFADGGKVTMGTTSRADDVLARISKDETIVSASHSRLLAPAMAAVGVPGYAGGGKPGARTGGSKFGPGSPGTATPSGSPFSIGGIGKWLVRNAEGLISKGAVNAIASLIPGGSTILQDIMKNGAVAATKVLEAPINATIKGANGPASLIRHGSDDVIQAAIQAVTNAVTAQETVSSGSGAAVAKYAEQFRGHRYVLGGSGDYQTKHDAPYGPWDCAGFVGQMYHHFGINAPFPGINVSSLRKWAKFTDKPEVGGMAFWVTDGTKANPGHVGMVTGKDKSIQAMDPALGTRDSNLAGALDFAIPPKGFGTAGVGPTKAGYVNIGRGLMQEGFARAAAAGIVGCIAGESGGNPESKGTGGYGLIGWTPVGSAYPFSNILTGNNAVDMGHEITDIKAYVQRNGSMGDMNRWKDAVSAADWFSERYERPAVHLSDVQPSVARSTYAALDSQQNHLMMPGFNTLYNGLGQPEWLTSHGKAGVGGGRSASAGGGTIVMVPTDMCTGCDTCTRKSVQAIKQFKRHNGNAKLGID